MAVLSGQYKTSYLTALTDTSSTDKEGIGTMRLENGKLYRWVKFTTGTATLASVVGGLVGFLATDKTMNTVCSDYSDCVAALLAGQTLVAGITTAYYCWIQVGGVGAALTNDITSAAVGKTVSLSGDDQALLLAADTTHPGGVIVDATAGAQKLFLQCLHI